MSGTMSDRRERIRIRLQERRTRVALLALLVLIVILALIAITYGVIMRDEEVPIPDAPTELQAVAVSAMRIDLSWRDNSDNEVGFSIERRPDIGDRYEVLTTVGADIFSYADTDVLGDTGYYYRVRSYNDGGFSGYSNVATAVTPELQPPNAPSNLGAEAIASGWIDLSWWDNSDDEAGFKILRRKEGGIYRLVDDVGADVSQYSDIGLTESTTYFYQVRAYNDAGNSDFSNEAVATTLDPTYHIWGGVAQGKTRQVSVGEATSTTRCKELVTLEGYVAPAGHVFVVVPVTFTNTGSDVVVVSAREFALREFATREVFGMHRCPATDKGEGFKSFTVGAGSTVSGVIFYVVPKSVAFRDLQVVYLVEGSVHIWPRPEELGT